ncbi:Pimeloyl-ACP methyl ester carboxylesterase [Amycolatopsis arida]|uniref:Pimeloyl-ACP methyl ester carboxylesterase n=1 Tax=Amycolatopsis arida TaxID=587909 RepID=A0A1I5V440_9PSEU|nr:alpha/beta hydrolase [Amycolatopsis arida]TDX91141.1 pimeloyl-ACP methyl ester carboxylesterase [Amycolatopsis arida]SFQ02211.1 Pimeloyl-ACP methyl ester carboxylesterase [Amycolatopsis arida]
MSRSDTMRSVRVDGARLAFAELGDPSAEPIVLLHGYPANHLSWRHQLPGLAEHHRVLALDWLGWGESERRTDLRFDYDTEVDRLGRVLDALGIDGCNLFGHDYGGFLALGFAQRHPARVRRLAILNSRAHRTFAPAWYAIFSLVSLLGRGPLAGAFARLLPLATINRVGMRQALRAGIVDRDTLDSYLGWMSTEDGARWLLHYFGQYQVPARPELAEGLGTIRCPTAIIWGTADTYLRTTIAEELATRIPDAELTVIDDAGHFVMEQAPDAVLAALRRLLTPSSSPQQR